MKKTNLSSSHKNFLEYYAKTLNLGESAKAAGYKGKGAINTAQRILDNPQKLHELEKIIKKNAQKFEITKAYLIGKYLKIIDYALFEDENGLKDPQLGLRALDGLCKNAKCEPTQDAKQSKISIFENIEGLDINKI